MNMRKLEGRHWVALMSCFLLGSCATTSTTDFSSHALPTVAAAAPPPPPPPVATTPSSAIDLEFLHLRQRPPLSLSIPSPAPLEVTATGYPLASSKSSSPRKQLHSAPVQAAKEIAANDWVTNLPTANVVTSKTPEKIQVDETIKITVLMSEELIADLKKSLDPDSREGAKNLKDGATTQVKYTRQMKAVCTTGKWLACRDVTPGRSVDNVQIQGVVDRRFKWVFELTAIEPTGPHELATIDFDFFLMENFVQKDRAALKNGPKPISITVAVKPQSFSEWIAKTSKLFSDLEKLVAAATALAGAIWGAISWWRTKNKPA
jgi:hypothetical protein